MNLQPTLALPRPLPTARGKLHWDISIPVLPGLAKPVTLKATPFSL